MFCVKCGHPLDEGDSFCANCGAAVQNFRPKEIQTESLHEAQPETTTPKKNTNLLLLFGAGVLVLAAVVVLLLNFGGLKNWFVRSVSTPEDLMAVAYKTAVAQSFSSVLENFSSSMEAIQASKYAGSSQIVWKPGQQILDMLSYAVYGGEGDMSWLSDVRLSVNYILDDNLQKHILEIGLGEHAITSIELIADTEAEKQYLSLPELSKQTLCMDLSQGADMSSADMTELYKAMPSAENAVQIFNRYLDVLLGGFSNVEKKSENLTLEDLSQEVTVLEAYMDHVDLIETMITFLEQLKQDTDIKTVLEGLNPWYNDRMQASMADAFMESEYENQDLYAEFLAQIDASLAQLREELPKADPENHLYLYTYLNDTNGITGIKLTVSGMEENVSCLTVSKNGQFVSQILLGDLQIKGNGTEAETLNGSYTVEIENEKLLDIKLENVTKTAATAYIEPTAALLAGIAGEMGMEAGMVSMADVALCIRFEGTAQNSNCAISLLANEVSLMELQMFATGADLQEIVLPANTVDSSDEESSFNWLVGLDIEGLREKLQAAGVPDELLAVLLA